MKQVLIVEDDLLIADMVADVLQGEGFGVCGIARTVEEALALAAQHRPKLAIVDVNLAKGGRGTSVASILIDKYKTGILYTTGSQASLSNAPGQAFLLKPFRLQDVEPALNVVAELAEKGISSRPLPPNLTIL
jgi:DNA-binding response OmpR family regulator